jgi:hypothetical protein
MATAVPALALAIAVFMVLNQLQIATEIVTITYAALLGSLALGCALAFGLGGRDVASRMLEDAYRRGQLERERYRAQPARTPRSDGGAAARRLRRPAPAAANDSRDSSLRSRLRAGSGRHLTIYGEGRRRRPSRSPGASPEPQAAGTAKGELGRGWVPRPSLFCPPAVEIGDTLAAVTPSPVPGKRDVVVEYLLVNTEGKMLAVLQSPAQVLRQLARIESESEANESVRVGRHVEHRSDLVATESFVTAMPLPSLLERPRRR